MSGVRSPTAWPISRTDVSSVSISSGLPASASWSIEVFIAPSFLVTALRSYGLSSMGQPIFAPIAAASVITPRQKALTRSSSRIRSDVAPVSTETGFMVMLPQSLYQMSRRMRVETVTSIPAAPNVSASAVSRAETRPSGSPTMNPWPALCRVTPGSGALTEMCTTQPMTCGVGSAAVNVPPGSTAGSRSPSHGPPNPSKNHHGTPFMAATMTVSWSSSGAMRAATDASAGPLTAITMTSCGPSSAGSSVARTGAVTGPSAVRSRQPCARSARSVAPRATAVVTWPAAASRAPTYPPTAPAPTTHMPRMTPTASP
jgi:hypothetical protein